MDPELRPYAGVLYPGDLQLEDLVDIMLRTAGTEHYQEAIKRRLIDNLTALSQDTNYIRQRQNTIRWLYEHDQERTAILGIETMAPDTEKQMNPETKKNESVKVRIPDNTIEIVGEPEKPERGFLTSPEEHKRVAREQRILGIYGKVQDRLQSLQDSATPIAAIEGDLPVELRKIVEYARVEAGGGTNRLLELKNHNYGTTIIVEADVKKDKEKLRDTFHEEAAIGLRIGEFSGIAAAAGLIGVTAANPWVAIPAVVTVAAGSYATALSGLYSLFHINNRFLLKRNYSEWWKPLEMKRSDLVITDKETGESVIVPQDDQYGKEVMTNFLLGHKTVRGCTRVEIDDPGTEKIGRVGFGFEVSSAYLMDISDFSEDMQAQFCRLNEVEPTTMKSYQYTVKHIGTKMIVRDSFSGERKGFISWEPYFEETTTITTTKKEKTRKRTETEDYGHRPKKYERNLRKELYFLEGFSEEANLQLDIADAFEQQLINLKADATIAAWAAHLKEKHLHPIIFPTFGEHTTIESLVHPYLGTETPAVVANNYQDNGTHTFVITGPNGNGKTTYIHGVILAHAMAQAGWPIVAEQATIRPRDQVLTHTIKPGEFKLGESRSMFEASRVGIIIDRVMPDSLILFDETYTGTEPSAGKNALQDLLEILNGIGSTNIVTTHYHDLIPWADSTPGVKNLHAAIGNNGDPQYKIADGGSRVTNFERILADKGVDIAGNYRKLKERLANGDLPFTPQIEALLEKLEQRIPQA